MKTIVVIAYKSGSHIRVACDSCKVTWRDARITGISIVNGWPRALYYGLDEIESVYEEPPEERPPLTRR